MTSTLVPRTRIAVGTGVRVAFAVLGAAAVAVLGLFLDPATAWAGRQDWLPAGDVLELLARVAAACPTWVQVLGGVLLGGVAGLVLVGESSAVEVSAEEVVVLDGRRRRRVARSQVGRAVLEGRRLSVRDRDDVDLVTVVVDGDLDALRTALAGHGWPLRDGGG